MSEVMFSEKSYNECNILIFYSKFNYNQWQNIMGILKSAFKIPPFSHTMLRTHNIARRKIRSLFLNIVKREKGRETQNCPNSSFSHIFCPLL